VGLVDDLRLELHASATRIQTQEGIGVGRVVVGMAAVAAVPSHLHLTAAAMAAEAAVEPTTAQRTWARSQAFCESGSLATTPVSS